jgi:DNA repair and recombination protein RAD54 and RAD54-like protein
LFAALDLVSRAMSDSDEPEPSSAAEDSDDDFDDEAVEQEEEDDEPVIMSQAEIKRANVQAMLSGSLEVQRKPMVRGLQCQNVAAVLAQPFRAPFAGATAGHSAELARRLAARRRFVPWGSNSNIAHPGRPLGLAGPGNLGLGLSKPAEEVPEELPPGVEPLVLWEGVDAEGKELPPVSVDNMLVKFLRPHQREGVKFVFECVMGLRGFDGHGCILADDMGLGKTLQGITLLWTLLKQGITRDGGPVAKRALIVCPTSLVANWDDECIKWLNGKVRTMPICEANRADVISSMNRFLNYQGHDRAQVMIVSYETFRIHAERFDKPNSVVSLFLFSYGRFDRHTDVVFCLQDLIICDEAHRLKNGDTLTNKALGSVPCLRRVMLSGTPMQNNLDEFYAMVNFCNPGLLGTSGEFYKKFEKPILDGREPDATDKQLALAQERNGELSELVNKFVLRRTNTILSKHLPPKVVEVVCCKLSPLQQMIYRHFLSEKAAKTIATGKSAMVLAAITGLKKLCNHPKLIHDMITATKTTNKGAAGFESCADFFGDGLYDSTSGRGLGRERAGGGLPDGWETHSGKFAVLARLLAILRKETKDRIVIISNYTQTLDLIQTLCAKNRYPICRLDGSTGISKRQKLVKKFNDPTEDCFVFLLSSKAGGCGINLIGGNRLVLFDPDWNPANDKQAAGEFILFSYTFSGITRAIRLTSCFVYSAMLARRPEEEVLPVPFPRHRFHRGEGVPATAQQRKFAERGERRRYAGAELDE